MKHPDMLIAMFNIGVTLREIKSYDEAYKF